MSHASTHINESHLAFRRRKRLLGGSTRELYTHISMTHINESCQYTYQRHTSMSHVSTHINESYLAFRSRKRLLGGSTCALCWCCDTSHASRVRFANIAGASRHTFTCVICLIRTCDMTCSHVRHVSFVCVT